MYLIKSSPRFDLSRRVTTKEGAIKDFYDKFHTIFFLFDYGKDYPNIKIEFNKRIWNNNRYKTIWFMGIRMKIVDESTLITNKLVVLSDRKAMGKSTFNRRNN